MIIITLCVRRSSNGNFIYSVSSMINYPKKTTYLKLLSHKKEIVILKHKIQNIWYSRNRDQIKSKAYKKDFFWRKKKK